MGLVSLLEFELEAAGEIQTKINVARTEKISVILCLRKK